MAYNEKVIWDFFKSQGLSDTYCAAFIGNLWFESGQDLEYGSTCKQGAGTGASSSSQQYTNSVNNKSYSEYSFVHDDIGYGIAQWTYYSRKQGLYDYTVKNGLSIGDLETQLNYLVTEAEYKKTIDALNKLSPTEREDVDTCTRVVCEVFENPGIPHLDQRQTKANNTYKSYSGSSISTTVNTPLSQSSTPQSQTTSSYITAQQNLVNIAMAAADNPSAWGVEGSNNNVYTRWATDTGTTNWVGADWCAIMCSAMIAEAGVEWPMSQTQQGIEGFASVPQLYAAAQAAGCLLPPDQAQPGDLIIYGNSQQPDAHVGIVVAGYGLECSTVEGNVRGSRLASGYGGDGSDDVHFYERPWGGDGWYVSGVVRLSGLSNKVLESGSNLDYSSSSPIYEDQSLPAVTYKDVTVEVRTSTIVTADVDPNTARTKSTSLLDTPTLVESPFIILKIGDYTFGSYSIDGSFEIANSNVKVTYPNYMTSIRILKVNGQVNQYTITMVYQIENGNDPNLLDKVFASVGYGTVLISYGDWNAPKFAYRDEEAIITKLDTNVDFANSRITYTLHCTSNALMLAGGYYNFKNDNLKPSTEIHRIVYSPEYHLLDVFNAFKDNEAFFWKCVASDDVSVEVLAKTGIDALSYINYLVTCMTPTTTPKYSALRDANYYLTICEDRDLGTYFTIKKVSSTEDVISLNNSDVYEVDVGYPGDTMVTDFRIVNDNSWSLLYNYSQNINMNNYVYNVDNTGNIYESYSPNITTSSRYLKTTETQRNWWTQMTQFPIQATLKIKGLLRPAMLMSYVRINAMFYGLRHVSSGLYIIIKQEDQIDSAGYRTTLTLQRIAGDLDVIVTDTKMVTKTIPVINYDYTNSSMNSQKTTTPTTVGEWDEYWKDYLDKPNNEIGALETANQLHHIETRVEGRKKLYALMLTGDAIYQDAEALLAITTIGGATVVDERDLEALNWNLYITDYDAWLAICESEGGPTPYWDNPNEQPLDNAAGALGDIARKVEQEVMGTTAP